MLNDMVGRFRLGKMQSLSGSDLRLLESGRGKEQNNESVLKIVLDDTESDKY